MSNSFKLQEIMEEFIFFFKRLYNYIFNYNSKSDSFSIVFSFS